MMPMLPNDGASTYFMISSSLLTSTSSYPKTLLTKPRMPEDFVTTIGSKVTRKAHIYSNAKDTFNDAKSDNYPDSWDSQGIYHKKEFQLTTMDARQHSKDSLV
jgi:hypothetical protein